MPAGVRLVVLAASVLLVAGCTSARSTSGDGTAVHSSAVAASPSPSTSATAASPTTARSRTRQASRTPTRPRTTPHPVPRPPVAAPAQLPLAMPTGSATRILTVVAPSSASTTGTLQAWQRSGSGWTRVGPTVPAWLGSDGVSARPSETLAATPIGSFTLTQAFGRAADPGTALPYRQTTPGDWWISQPGPLYNTLQHCTGACPFTQGEPNEHLYFTTPYYDYAAVIDYNRSPVVQGAGSAFFLHVAVGAPTQGCVAIPQANLVSILRWLTPAAHPRILIGVG